MDLSKYHNTTVRIVVKNGDTVSGACEWFPPDYGLHEFSVEEESLRIGDYIVFENDFHERKDLTPNVCAVYVDEKFRNQGVTGFMLQYVCEDMEAMGYDTLYLLTDHTGFYERYGWQFLCMARGSDGEMSRMYVHYSGGSIYR